MYSYGQRKKLIFVRFIEEKFTKFRTIFRYLKTKISLLGGYFV